MRGIIRLAVLVLWALIVFAAGGWAVRHGGGEATTGGIELAALVLGVAAIMLTPAWGRSIDRSREHSGV